MTKRAESGIGRRTFLAGAGAAAFTIVKPSLVRGSEANSTIELGLIGCGGRGMWIADLFQKHGKYKFVAGADYFPERLDKFGEKFGVDASRRHDKLSGYKKLLDSKLDAVVIETPPYAHPEQAEIYVNGKSTLEIIMSAVYTSLLNSTPCAQFSSMQIRLA